jgi:hypothetical protein
VAGGPGSTWLVSASSRVPDCNVEQRIGELRETTCPNIKPCFDAAGGEFWHEHLATHHGTDLIKDVGVDVRNAIMAEGA